jgi:hypothetical protein
MKFLLQHERCEDLLGKHLLHDARRVETATTTTRVANDNYDSRVRREVIEKATEHFLQ